MSTMHPAVAARRVVVVEPHADTAHALTVLLTRAGHQVRTASTADEARQICCDGECDVVLSELRLPSRSGLELPEELKTNCPHTKFIALTTMGMTQDVEQAHRAGFHVHLLKPMGVEKILNQLDELDQGTADPAAE